MLPGSRKADLLGRLLVRNAVPQEEQVDRGVPGHDPPGDVGVGRDPNMPDLAHGDPVPDVVQGALQIRTGLKPLQRVRIIDAYRELLWTNVLQDEGVKVTPPALVQCVREALIEGGGVSVGPPRSHVHVFSVRGTNLPNPVKEGGVAVGIVVEQEGGPMRVSVLGQPVSVEGGQAGGLDGPGRPPQAIAADWHAGLRRKAVGRGDGE